MLLYQEEDRHGKKMSMRTSIVHMYQKVWMYTMHAHYKWIIY
jgi:hypothetical protein